MENHRINSESDYRRALARADVLMDAAPGSRELGELRALAARIEAWEREHYPIARPSPRAALKFRADQLGYAVARAVIRSSRIPKFAAAKKVAARAARKRLVASPTMPVRKRLRTPATVTARKAARLSGRSAVRRAARKKK
jgi:HTH-type transcriptional regulator/antitoxin HigA